MSSDAQNTTGVERLREILLSPDREQIKTLELELQNLRHTIADKEALIASLNPVVADLLERKIASSGAEMAEIVAPLMGPAIKQQVAESKDEMVEALYPVIGQTVRRAVAEAMRKLVKQINERLDKAFNLQTTWARLKAKIIGMPAPLAALPQVFPFTIEQLFLIDQRTGLLIAHAPVTPEGEINGKLQMMSGMLTAIQDFTKDAFGSENAGDLHEVKYGDKMIFVAANPPAFLAAVTIGAAPLQFSDKLRGLLRRIHNTWHRELRAYDGEASALQAAVVPLQKFLMTFSESVAVSTKPEKEQHAHWYATTFAKICYGILLGLALAGVAWFFWQPRETQTPAQAPVQAAVQPALITPGPNLMRLEARLDGRVWMNVVTDNQDSTDFIFQRGEVYVWRARDYFRVAIGNAGQTELFLDGESLGRLGETHQSVSLRITREGIIERY